LKPQTAPQI